MHLVIESRLYIARRLKRDGVWLNEHSGVYEGEVQVSDPQEKEALQQLIGDGNAKVTVSRTMSESDFGTGGSVMTSVTLTCHQGQQFLDVAEKYAASLANRYCEEELGVLRNDLARLGIIR